MVAVLAIAAVIGLPFLVDTPRVQTLIAGSASQALGRPVKFASLSVAVFPRPAVKLHALEVAEDPRFGPGPFLKLETGRLALKLRPLVGGRVEFGDLTLSRPVISLVQNPDGLLNIASLGGPADGRSPARAGRPGAPAAAGGAGAALPARVTIEKATITYVARGQAGIPSRYRVDDLDLTVTTGPTLGFEGRARVQPGDLAVAISEGRLALDGARSLGEASVSARVAVEGTDIAALVTVFAGPAPAIGGPIKATLAVSGRLGAPKAAGSVELASVRVRQTTAACPEPRLRTLTLTGLKLAGLAWEGNRLTSRPVTASLAGGTVSTSLTVTLDRGVRLALADLAVKGLPLEPVLVDFLCQGYAVTGPLDLTGALSASGPDLLGTLSGPGQLRIGPGRVVGSQALALIGGVVRVGGALSSPLSADLPMSLFASPLEFDSITGTYRIADGVVTIRDLTYASRVMKVAVAGEYGLATGRLNLDLVVSHGRGQARAKVTGTAAAPSVKVEPSSLVRDRDPTKVEGGLKDLLRRFR
ncbi:MAG: AsmA family protein [Candidatus Rokubacteria bacterium]|nr:AsmA family protein [Candidatus Rokubacteria bacterium]